METSIFLLGLDKKFRASLIKILQLFENVCALQNIRIIDRVEFGQGLRWFDPLPRTYRPPWLTREIATNVGRRLRRSPWSGCSRLRRLQLEPVATKIYKFIPDHRSIMRFKTNVRHTPQCAKDRCIFEDLNACPHLCLAY